ncbi:MAG: hypothetical protein AABY75_05750 [Bacteroidota bacterium]
MKFLFAAAFLFSAAPVLAQTNVYETARGTGTVHNVLVTSAAAIKIDSSTRTITGYSRFAIEVYNDDSSGTAWCNFSALVSSTAGNIHYGRRIGPRTAWTLAIPGPMPVYCISDSSAGIYIVLTQIH